MFKSGIPIGKAFGISLRLHFSWFIVFALVTFSLAGSYFPVTYPGWSRATSIVVGLVTSLLFFGSVLAHELAHSLVAQAAGLPIQSITLFIFGGVSEISEEPKQPGVEFRMALAGPLTSFALGGLFFGIRALEWMPQEVVAAAFWLGWINLSLGIFNLIPGFPLDGGRVLRSILWSRSNSLRSATRTASNVGRAVGYIFIFVGVIFVFTGNWFSGLWLAFIGWFLENAAVGSYRQLALQDMLRGHTVKEAMVREFPAVPPDMTVEELVGSRILTTGRRYFPVVSDDHFVGMVSLRGVRSVPRELWRTRTVREIMTPADAVKGVRERDDLSNVLKLLAEEDVSLVPVTADGHIVGVVARENLLSFISVRAELGM
ncbi:MAG: site-2 protease family protein [Chloroflexi bacterium]|nr:site-2 protease family protein [Chloroflexota bacterium]